ncbi:Imm10 family immunity protein [Micromonospora sp. NPDC049679]|uniref:Imm10 family immunity protein n=1 Tax=Micromonospora sp. NPDC049679 TaxID=3155920 RepID=UPI0033EA52F1
MCYNIPVTSRFVAQLSGVSDDEGCLTAGVAEQPDGTGRSLIFMCDVDPAEAQDVDLGMDAYCLVTETHGTAYGCVEELTLVGDELRVLLREDAISQLDLEDRSVEVRLDLDRESVDDLSDALRRILTYGRADARPTVLTLPEPRSSSVRRRGRRRRNVSPPVVPDAQPIGIVVGLDPIEAGHGSLKKLLGRLADLPPPDGVEVTLTDEPSLVVTGPDLPALEALAATIAAWWQEDAESGSGLRIAGDGGDDTITFSLPEHLTAGVAWNISMVAGPMPA